MRKPNAKNDWAVAVVKRLNAAADPKRGPKTYYLRSDLVEGLDTFASSQVCKPSAALEVIIEEFLAAVRTQGKGPKKAK